MAAAMNDGTLAAVADTPEAVAGAKRPMPGAWGEMSRRQAKLGGEALEVRWSQYFMSLGMEKSAPSPQTGGRKEVALRGIVQCFFF
jgi:hypothetical protein